MSRPKSRNEKPGQRERPGVRVKIYVRDDMIGGGKMDLLKLAAEHGSISGASKAMGVDYKRAWFLLDTLQRCFEQPLFIARRGGENRGAEITPLGRELIERYDTHRAAVDAASAGFLDWLTAEQRQSDD